MLNMQNYKIKYIYSYTVLFFLSTYIFFLKTFNKTLLGDTLLKT